jgi:hypothetical protein
VAEPHSCHADSRRTVAHTAFAAEQVSRNRVAERSSSPSEGGGGSGAASASDPSPQLDYLLIPALAEITGDGRRWTVSMISELSIPWR